MAMAGAHAAGCMWATSGSLHALDHGHDEVTVHLLLACLSVRPPRAQGQAQLGGLGLKLGCRGIHVGQQHAGKHLHGHSSTTAQRRRVWKFRG